jgi:endoglucanase
MRSLLVFFLLVAAAHAQSDAIRLNQIGFYPDGPKVAVAVGAAAGTFTVHAPGDPEPVLIRELGPAETWGPSGETVRLADFSDLDVQGEYVVSVDGLGTSHPFLVSDRVHQEVARGALKAFYFMRASVPLEPAYAGPWSRPAGHPDDRVLVHNSAATAGRPAGTVIASPGGWYDAGDYNKYVVNSGISVGTLLLLLEQYPEYAAGLDTAIPESGDAVPDLLDETLVNVRWMLTMQDEDGGVYHKLTTANFSGEVMPHRATATRYVVTKGTAATLDFAATMAQASRVVAGYEDAFPGFADSLRVAAEAAWVWADANPDVAYEQWALSDPAVNTGTYAPGGDDFADEFDWAAWELYLTTGDTAYLDARPIPASPGLGTPWWGSVREMGYYSLLTHRDRIAADVDVDAIAEALVGQAGWFASMQAASAYNVVMGGQPWMWGWGSNSTAANQGLALVMAYQLSGDRAYLDAAIANLDYLLGRNGTGYSFLTGFGDKTPMGIHHRPSEADGVPEPVPGLLAGGPNPGQEDGCSYPVPRGTLPARSYVDDWCSYASNEITINWNAPLVYLATAIEAELSETGLPSATDSEPRGALPVEGFPNPFRAEATIRFELAAASDVTVRMFDALGREVGRPLDGAARGAGVHRVPFDARDLPGGLYLYRVETDGAASVGTLTLAR